jgi:hypothetical protein
MVGSTTARPDGFRVDSCGRELTISWGRAELRERLAAIVLAALPFFLLLPFLEVKRFTSDKSGLES